MNIRRLYTLLIAWCVFVIAPGVLVAAGVFGPIDKNSDITGGVIFLWIAGYLTQFAAFMWMMNIVGKQKVLWWFVASLAPWAMDWTMPVSPLFALLWLPATIGLACWIGLVARRAQLLQQQGVRAVGVVLKVLEPWMNVVINNVYIRRKVRLRIERADGTPPYEGILNGTFMFGEIPSPGDRMPLLVDPANPQRFEYNEGADSAQAAAVGSTVSSATDRENIADELEKLADLRNRGALTDSEFNAAKKRLLR